MCDIKKLEKWCKEKLEVKVELEKMWIAGREKKIVVNIERKQRKATSDNRKVMEIRSRIQK